MDISDDLIKRCLANDRLAQSELFAACFPVLMGIARRYQVNEEDQRSLVHDSFLKILQGLKTKKRSSPIESWVRRIMLNTIIDNYRKEKNYRSQFVHSEQNTLLGLSVQDEHIFRQYDAEELLQMVQNLPAATRAVFNLFAIDGFAHNEIARHLKIAEGTSRWHLAQARSLLAAMLKKRFNQQKNKQV